MAAVARRPVIGFALSAGGYVFALLIILLTLPAVGPTGDVGRLFDPVGDAFRAGQPVYVAGVETPFFYAPPWVLLLGALTWLPVEAQLALVWAVNLAALRYLGGSWLAVGWLAWFPLVAFSLLGATLNIAMAGAIAAGARGVVTPVVGFAFAKISPILALHPRHWRPALIVSLVLIAVTLPWLQLWPEWARQLVTYAGSSIGPQIPVPFLLRLPLAVLLLLLRRPWASALAAVVALPSFYWESLVVFLAPLCVYLRRPRGQRPVA